MALQSIARGAELWWPHIIPVGSQTMDQTTLRIDTGTESVALITKAPKTGNIDKFIVLVSSPIVQPTNGLRFSFQDVGTNSLPDGVVDQFAIVPSGSVTASSVLDPGAFDSARAVTVGDEFACVLDMPSWVAGDVTFTSYHVGGGTMYWHVPYTVLNGTIGTRMLMALLHYDDDTWEPVHSGDSFWTGGASYSLQTTTNPVEAGIGFQVPFPTTLRKIMHRTMLYHAGNNIRYTLYDASDNVLATIDHYTDARSQPGDGYSTEYLDSLWLGSEVNLSANATHRLTLQALTAGKIVSVIYHTYTTASYFNAAPGADRLWLTSRPSGGAWTDFNNAVSGYRKPYTFYLGLGAFDDGASGGGGGGIAPRMIMVPASPSRRVR